MIRKVHAQAAVQHIISKLLSTESHSDSMHNCLVETDRRYRGDTSRLIRGSVMLFTVTSNATSNATLTLIIPRRPPHN